MSTCLTVLLIPWFSVITHSAKKTYITQQYNSKKMQHIHISTFSCSGRQRPAHSPFLVFLFGLPSLLCPLSEHHSFLLCDPALGCGLHGLAPSHPSSTTLKTLLCTVLCLHLKAEGLGCVRAASPVYITPFHNVGLHLNLLLYAAFSKTRTSRTLYFFCKLCNYCEHLQIHRS